MLKHRKDGTWEPNTIWRNEDGYSTEECELVSETSEGQQPSLTTSTENSWSSSWDETSLQEHRAKEQALLSAWDTCDTTTKNSIANVWKPVETQSIWKGPHVWKEPPLIEDGNEPRLVDDDKQSDDDTPNPTSPMSQTHNQTPCSAENTQELKHEVQEKEKVQETTHVKKQKHLARRRCKEALVPVHKQLQSQFVRHNPDLQRRITLYLEQQEPRSPWFDEVDVRKNDVFARALAVINDTCYMHLHETPVLPKPEKQSDTWFWTMCVFAMAILCVYGSRNPPFG